MKPAAKRLVASVQPHSARKPKEVPIFVLRRLNGRDKHRELFKVRLRGAKRRINLTVLPDGGNHEIAEDGGFAIPIIGDRIPPAAMLHVDTRCTFLVGGTTLEPGQRLKIDFDPKSVVEVFVNGAGNPEVVHLMNEIIHQVNDIVSRFADAWESICP